MRRLEGLIGACAGREVLVVGTGTSLKDFDFGLVRGRVVIGLNDLARFYAPDYHLFADNLWKRRYSKECLWLPQTEAVTTRKDAVQPSCIAAYREVYCFEKGEGLLEGTLFSVKGGTIAATGIHLAALLGASRVGLLGVDGYRLPDSRYFRSNIIVPRKKYKVVSRDRTRLVEKHHTKWNLAVRQVLDLLKCLDMLPPRGVFNLNPESTIDCLPRVDATEWLLPAEETV